jgi:CHAD domain-containing protein
MIHDQLRATAHGYAAAMQDVAAGIAPSFDADTIHRFRVETKRLRALMRLVHVQSEGLQVRLGKRFKEMYAALGEIRDAQMHLIRVVKEPEPPLPGYALWLASRIGEGQRRWMDAYNDKPLGKLREMLADLDWPDALEPDTLRQFVAAHLDAIGDVLGRPALQDEDVHDIRKKVKDLQHILRWARKEWPEGTASLAEMNLDAVEDLAQRAGDYNDERNAIDTLEVFLREAAGGKEKEAAEAVRQRWIQTRDQNREALLRDIDAFRGVKDMAGPPL